MPAPETYLRRKLTKILGSQTAKVDLEALLAETVDAFGGAHMLALELKKVYDGAHKSPLVQQKILLMIQQMVHAVTIHSLGKPINPSSMSDDELEGLAVALMVKVADEPEPEEEADAAAPGGELAAADATA